MNKVMMHQSSRMRDEFDAWAKTQGLRTDLAAQFPGQADHMKPYNSTKTSGAWLVWQQLYPLQTSRDAMSMHALLTAWGVRAASAHPSDAMLINKHIRELKELYFDGAPNSSTELTDKKIDEIYNQMDWDKYPQIGDSKSILEMETHRHRAFARAAIAYALKS